MWVESLKSFVRVFRPRRHFYKKSSNSPLFLENRQLRLESVIS